jgi:hypothetical protein
MATTPEEPRKAVDGSSLSASSSSTSTSSIVSATEWLGRTSSALGVSVGNDLVLDGEGETLLVLIRTAPDRGACGVLPPVAALEALRPPTLPPATLPGDGLGLTLLCRPGLARLASTGEVNGDVACSRAAALTEDGGMGCSPPRPRPSRDLAVMKPSSQSGRAAMALTRARATP